MLTQGGFRKTIHDLHDAHMQYFVTGGVAYDGLRGQWTREHKDLNIFVFNESMTRLIDEFSAFGYECYRKGSIYLLRNGETDIDVLPLRHEGMRRVIDGNLAQASYPLETFTTRQARIDGTLFSIVRNEVLISSAMHDHPDDRAFAKTLPVDRDILDRIIVNEKERKPYDITKIA
jgi:hypothetical protein